MNVDCTTNDLSEKGLFVHTMHRSVGTLTIGRNGIEHATALREPNSAKLPFAFDERIKEIFLEHSNQTIFFFYQYTGLHLISKLNISQDYAISCDLHIPKI